MRYIHLCLNVLCVFLLCANSASAQQRGAKPQPDHSDVKYGPHERNVLDLWLAKSDMPTPLVLYIHGGGFRGGDKGTLQPDRLKAYLRSEEMEPGS